LFRRDGYDGTSALRQRKPAAFIGETGRNRGQASQIIQPIKTAYQTANEEI
jgi:hypothetical protein